MPNFHSLFNHNPAYITAFLKFNLLFLFNVLYQAINEWHNSFIPNHLPILKFIASAPLYHQTSGLLSFFIIKYFFIYSLTFKYSIFFSFCSFNAIFLINQIAKHHLPRWYHQILFHFDLLKHSSEFELEIFSF